MAPDCVKTRNNNFSTSRYGDTLNAGWSQAEASVRTYDNWFLEFLFAVDARERKLGLRLRNHYVRLMVSRRSGVMRSDLVGTSWVQCTCGFTTLLTGFHAPSSLIFSCGHGRVKAARSPILGNRAALAVECLLKWATWSNEPATTINLRWYSP